MWAEPEKALLDYIYISLKINKGVMALDEVNWEALKTNRLRELSPIYPESVREALRLWIDPS